MTSLNNISMINNTMMKKGISINNGWSSKILITSLKFIENIGQLDFLQFSLNWFSLSQYGQNVLLIELPIAKIKQNKKNLSHINHKM